MKLNLFRAYCYNKDGTMNYDRASKYLGVAKNDLYFWRKGHFSLIDTPTLMAGVMVGYRPTSKSPMFYAPWTMKTCYHSNDDLRRIYEVVTRRNTPDWSTYDYFVMDCNGRMIYRNFDIQESIDENGIIHLSSPEHDLDDFVYPAERKKYPYKHFYCYGRNFKELNNHIKSAADAKIIKTPKNFKRGFEQTTEESLGR